MTTGKHIGKITYTKSKIYGCPVCRKARKISRYMRVGRKTRYTYLQKTCGNRVCRLEMRMRSLIATKLDKEEEKRIA